MKAYVTGATGCVGRNLVDELLKDKWDVIVLHRESSDLSRLKGCNVRFQPVDLYDLESVKRVLSESADAIFHVAGNVSHWPLEREQQYKDNVITTQNLVNAALEKPIGRFIFCSTGATGGGQENYSIAKTPEEADKIKNNYIRTKRLAEIVIEKAIDNGLNAIILKPIIIIGRYDYGNYSKIFKYLKTKRIKLCFPGNLSFCHAGDVARAHIQAYERGKKGEVYYLTGEYTSWYDVFCRIARLVGISPPLKPLPLWLYYVISFGMLQVSYITRKEPELTPDLITLVNCNNDFFEMEKRKSTETLGYSSRPLDVALKDCYDWLIAEGGI